MKTPSTDLCERKINAGDVKKRTRAEEAKRFRVSLDMVQKLLSQRVKTGDFWPRHRLSGRKSKLLPNYRKPLSKPIAKEPPYPA